MDYDNLRQKPTSFLYHGKTHRIDENLGRFRMLESRSVDAFLVRVVGGDVYGLVFQPRDVNQRHSGRWNRRNLMCEADAFLWRDGQEEKLLESVDVVHVETGEVKLINIFGEQKTIRCIFRRYENRPGKIVFEAV